MDDLDNCRSEPEADIDNRPPIPIPLRDSMILSTSDNEILPPLPPRHGSNPDSAPLYIDQTTNPPPVPGRNTSSRPSKKRPPKVIHSYCTTEIPTTSVEPMGSDYNSEPSDNSSGDPTVTMRLSSSQQHHHHHHHQQQQQQQQPLSLLAAVVVGNPKKTIPLPPSKAAKVIPPTVKPKPVVREFTKAPPVANKPGRLLTNERIGPPDKFPKPVRPSTVKCPPTPPKKNPAGSSVIQSSPKVPPRSVVLPQRPTKPPKPDMQKSISSPLPPLPPKASSSASGIQSSNSSNHKRPPMPLPKGRPINL